MGWPVCCQPSTKISCRAVRVTGFQPRDPRVNSLSYTLRIFTVPLAARALRSCWWFRLRAATCVRKRSESDLSATFEDLKIQSTGDVVKHLVHTTSLAAELLRGPGGKLRGPADPSSPSSLSSEICQVLSEAQSVCKAFLPQVLRGHASVSQLLDLFVEAFAVAGQPSHASAKAFKALETPLVIFHTKAPLAMRKALQSRIVGAAEKLLTKGAPPEAYPLGISLTALAAAVRGPGDVSKWKPPEVLQIRSQSRWKMPGDVRTQVLERDMYKCWYCGDEGDTVDHWIPLCRGGTNAMVNLVCACSSCNELKGNCMPDDFLAMTEATTS